MKKSGAQMVLACLKEQKVKTLFGYPGGAVIPLYDALYDELDYFNHIRTAHEQSAIHAADGYSRSTGKIGVAIVTSGPGATNAITGIANAYLDSIPLVIISGQVPSSLLGRDSFQEVDITGITMGITKKNYLVRNIKQLSDTLREAFEVAQSGRKGPVLIDIPKDIFLQETEYINPSFDENKESQDIKIPLLKDVLSLLEKSERPLIFAGGGVKSANASHLLTAFAEKLQIPVVNSLMGLGTIPQSHPLSFGLVGMHGALENNLAVINCDLLLAIGTRFSDRVTGKTSVFAKNATIVHFEIDPTEVNKNVCIDIALRGDLKKNLAFLLENSTEKKHDDWLHMIHTSKRKPVEKNLFTAPFILKNINEYYKNAFIATDVGQHQIWTAQHWKFEEAHRLITSGGLGTMGFGIGAAIGAQIGNPSEHVILMTGDGSFRMCSQELLTIKKYNLPIKIILFNNHALGMVRQWQDLFQNKKFSETNLEDHVDYTKLCGAYGIPAYKAENREDLLSILEDTKNCSSPLLIECLIDNNQFAYPIIPAGKTVENILEEQ